MLPALAGCGTKPVEIPPPVEVVDYRTPVVGGSVMNDGRKIGGTAKGKLGDELTNSFFSLCINKAALVDEYEGNKPGRGNLYLVAEVALANALDKPVPIWSNELLLQWGNGDRDFGYPIEKFADTQMDDECSLPVEGRITGDILFEVPAPEGSNEYNISYQEFYEDDVEGNTFYVIFSLEAS